MQNASCNGVRTAGGDEEKEKSQVESERTGGSLVLRRAQVRNKMGGQAGAS